MDSKNNVTPSKSYKYTQVFKFYFLYCQLQTIENELTLVQGEGGKGAWLRDCSSSHSKSDCHRCSFVLFNFFIRFCYSDIRNDCRRLRKPMRRRTNASYKKSRKGDLKFSSFRLSCLISE